MNLDLWRPLICGALAVAFLLVAGGQEARTQNTDPSLYQARVAKEVQPYLSDCAALSSDASGHSDQVDLGGCKSAQQEFAGEYYEALEGDQDAKFDVGFMFQRGDEYGVKYNATMACGWWIEMVNTGGRLPINLFDNAIAQACSASPDAVAAAASIYQEEQRVSHLTY